MKPSLELDGYVHPENLGRGLGGFCSTGQRRSRAAGSARASARRRSRRDPAAKLLIEGRGFEPVRHFYRMAIELECTPAEPVWPEGFAGRDFTPGDEAILHAVTEEAFADHWGHEPRELEHWHDTFASAGSLARLPRPREATRSRRRDQRLSVRDGLGRRSALAPVARPGTRAGAAAGCVRRVPPPRQRRIGLAVDGGNETGATHLYESVGMRVASQADVYERR